MKKSKRIRVGLLVAVSSLLLIMPGVKTYANESQGVTGPTEQKGQPEQREHFHHSKGWLDDAAAILKTDKHTLWKKLKSGKSLEEVAKEKGISKQQLKAGLKAKFQTRLNEAVKKGQLSEDKKNIIMSRFNAHIDQMITQKDWAKRVKKFRHFWLGAAAQVLNMDKETLKKELKSGKTLEEVAKEKGITKDQLKAGLQEIQKKKLDGLVKQGKMTSEKENEILSRTSEHLDKWISHKKESK
jgi:transposase-like protein